MTNRQKTLLVLCILTGVITALFAFGYVALAYLAAQPSEIAAILLCGIPGGAFLLIFMTLLGVLLGSKEQKVQANLEAKAKRLKTAMFISLGILLAALWIFSTMLTEHIDLGPNTGTILAVAFAAIPISLLFACIFTVRYRTVAKLLGK